MRSRSLRSSKEAGVDQNGFVAVKFGLKSGNTHAQLDRVDYYNITKFKENSSILHGGERQVSIIETYKYPFTLNVNMESSLTIAQQRVEKSVIYVPAIREPNRDAYASEGLYSTAKACWDAMMQAYEMLGAKLPTARTVYLCGQSAYVQEGGEWKPQQRRSIDEIDAIVDRYHMRSSQKSYWFVDPDPCKVAQQHGIGMVQSYQSLQIPYKI